MVNPRYRRGRTAWPWLAGGAAGAVVLISLAATALSKRETVDPRRSAPATIAKDALPTTTAPSAVAPSSGVPPVVEEPTRSADDARRDQLAIIRAKQAAVSIAEDLAPHAATARRIANRPEIASRIEDEPHGLAVIDIIKATLIVDPALENKLFSPLVVPNESPRNSTDPRINELAARVDALAKLTYEQSIQWRREYIEKLVNGKETQMRRAELDPQFADRLSKSLDKRLQELKP